MTDKQLDHLLEASASTPVAPPDFQRAVWGAIESRELSESLRDRCLTSLAECLARPLPRRAVWLVALSLGIVFGLRGGSKTSLDPVALYAHSINPAAPTIAP